MIERSRTLDEVFQQWKASHPLGTIRSFTPVGYRRCRTSTCVILIEEGQEREFCYGCRDTPVDRRSLEGSLFRD